MSKRKRAVEDTSEKPIGKTRRITSIRSPVAATHIHLITGSYERALHGIIATIPSSILDASNVPSVENTDNAQESPENIPGKQLTKNGDSPTNGEGIIAQPEKEVEEVMFADSFLFNAHTSAIRCLALSPIPKASDAQQKVILATGSTDERVNLYHISPSPPLPSKKGNAGLPSLSGASISQNPRNHELGALLHHAGAITALYFPTRSKLLSAAEDNTIAVSRSRDWTVLSTIKAPIPKPIGRPSGDTAGPGEVPAGVNDFAVHPSMKLMLSVGKGERSMRLWNLVTGKKAGVLTFEKDMLQQVGEGKFGTGEGRRILWDAAGQEFAVGFERGACIYNINSQPQTKICPTPLTKLHQMHYVPGLERNILAVSTEDGRILFYDTKPKAEGLQTITSEEHPENNSATLPDATLFAQLGGKPTGLTSRIKDFEILLLPEKDGSAPNKSIIVTAGSDGTVRLWFLLLEELQSQLGKEVPQVGQVLAKYETGNRITCLKAFVMTENVGEETQVQSEEEENGVENGDGSDSNSDESD